MKIFMHKPVPFKPVSILSQHKVTPIFIISNGQRSYLFKISITIHSNSNSSIPIPCELYTLYLNTNYSMVDTKAEQMINSIQSELHLCNCFKCKLIQSHNT